MTRNVAWNTKTTWPSSLRRTSTVRKHLPWDKHKCHNVFMLYRLILFLNSFLTSIPFFIELNIVYTSRVVTVCQTYSANNSFPDRFTCISPTNRVLHTMIILCKQLPSNSHEHSEKHSIKGAHMMWDCIIKGLKACVLMSFDFEILEDCVDNRCGNHNLYKHVLFIDIAIDSHLFLSSKLWKSWRIPRCISTPRLACFPMSSLQMFLCQPWQNTCSVLCIWNSLGTIYL